MDPVKNPFTPSAGRQPPQLAGRDSVLERARISLERMKAGNHDRSALLVGLRGVGKTVLLNRIFKMADQLDYQTAYLEALEDSPLAETIIPPLRTILLRLDLTKGATDKLQKAMNALRAFASVFEVKIGDIGVGVSAPGTADSGVLETDVSDLLVAVGEAAREKSTAVAIFVDELHNVKPNELGALIVGLHRVSQLELPLLFYGAGLPQLFGIAGDAKAYAERLFHYEAVGPLSTQDAIDAIQKPIEAAHETIDPAALKAIIRHTKGYPFFIQQWGKYVWNAAYASPISTRDVRAATPEAISVLDEGFFRVRMDKLSPAEKDYLRAMAEIGPGPHRSSDVAAQLQRPPESVAFTRNRLIAKGVAYAPSYGDIAFTVPMFDEYLKREIDFFAPKPPKKRAPTKKKSEATPKKAKKKPPR